MNNKCLTDIIDITKCWDAYENFISTIDEWFLYNFTNSIHSTQSNFIFSIIMLFKQLFTAYSNFSLKV